MSDSTLEPTEGPAGLDFQPGDVLFGKLRPYLAKSLLAQFHGCCSSEFLVLRSKSQLDPRFLSYVVESQPFVEWANTTTDGAKMPRSDWEAIGAFKMSLPEPERQTAIADFLDAEIRRIDSAIEKHQRLEQLTSERLDRAAEQALFPAPNLAELPADWTVRRAKYLFREVDERSGADDLPLLGVSIHHGVRRRDELTERVGRADSLDDYKRCCRGDIIVNRMRAFQGAVGASPMDGLVSPDYGVLRAKVPLDTRYYGELLRTSRYVGEMTALLRGIGSGDSGNVRTPRINLEDLLNIRLPVPPIDKQVLIAERVAALDNQAIRLEEAHARMISLLQERRRVVITVAVTGQLPFARIT